LFWANALLSGLLGVVLASASPLVAAFFHEPRLVGVTVALALGFTVTGFASQHVALLQRSLFFRSVALTLVVPQMVYVATAVVLALSGWGYWALVGGAVLQAVSTVVVALMLCRWIPGRPRRGVGAGRMLRFGGHVFGFNAVSYFSSNLDNILIGRYLGSEAVGLYAKAYGLFLMPMARIRTPISQVALPVLSQLRDDSSRYLRYYHGIVSVMSFLAVPLSLLCVFEADFLIRLLLGPQWDAAVPVFRVLATVALIHPIASTRGLVLLSHGQSQRLLYFGVVNACVVCGSFVVGLPYGINGVAVAFAIANYAILLPSLWYCFSGTVVRVGGFLRAVAPSLAVGAGASTVFAVELTNGNGSDAIHLAVSVAFLAVYALLSLTVGSFRQALRLLIESWRRERPQAPDAAGPGAGSAADSPGDLM
jgi:PST family polysaccharide transporter